MEELPKISIVLPNYNHALYLVDRLESIINQTYQNWELIVLDDNSLDNSQDIIIKYANKDKRIRYYFNKSNSGSVFKQWNKGVSYAQNELIWIAESDDIADTKFLESIITKITDKTALAYTDSYIIDSEGNITGQYSKLTPVHKRGGILENEGLFSGNYFFKEHACKKNFIFNASSVVFRKNAFLEIGGATSKYKIVGDWYVWANLLSQGDLLYINSPLNYHRRHEKSVTLTNIQILKEESISLIKEFYKKATGTTKYNCKKEIITRCLKNNPWDETISINKLNLKSLIKNIRFLNLPILINVLKNKTI